MSLKEKNEIINCVRLFLHKSSTLQYCVRVENRFKNSQILHRFKLHYQIICHVKWAIVKKQELAETET